MTKSDTAKIMAVLAIAYPAFYSKQSDDEKIAAVNYWAKQFADDDPAIVTAAVDSLVSTRESDFPPVIGQIKAAMFRLTSDLPTEAEAWSMAYDCICDSSSHPYDELPEIVRKAIGNERTVAALGMADVQELQTVVASNFMRTYRGLVESCRQRTLEPASVRTMLAGRTQVQQLEGGRA